MNENAPQPKDLKMENPGEAELAKVLETIGELEIKANKVEETFERERLLRVLGRIREEIKYNKEKLKGVVGDIEKAKKE